MKKFLILTVAAALCFSTSAFAGGGGGHGAAQWGYTGETGPEFWGKTYPECNGKSQSPINITGAAEKDLAPITFNYQQVPVFVVNNGHTIKADYKSGSSIEVGGKTYNLLQFHFHSPSENTIDGKSFPVEAHLVHADADGNLGVVGVMFEEGPANPVIEKIWRYMPTKGNSDLIANDIVDATPMLPESKDYYAFDGSLTTPPCSEGVKWMVLKTPVTVTPAQILKFQHIMHHDNNRPVQPLNGRVVYK